MGRPCPWLARSGHCHTPLGGFSPAIPFNTDDRPPAVRQSPVSFFSFFFFFYQTFSSSSSSPSLCVCSLRTGFNQESLDQRAVRSRNIISFFFPDIIHFSFFRGEDFWIFLFSSVGIFVWGGGIKGTQTIKCLFLSLSGNRVCFFGREKKNIWSDCFPPPVFPGPHFPIPSDMCIIQI
jgi:hypothetical protein